MRILALLGSPRKRGNTAFVLEQVLRPLREAAFAVDLVNLAGRRLSGCTECFTCQKRLDRPNCPVGDDIKPLYSKILRADAVVFATPIFCWGRARS